MSGKIWDENAGNKYPPHPGMVRIIPPGSSIAVEDLKDEIARLRKALEFYAVKERYKSFDKFLAVIIDDNGAVAREALK